MCGIAGWASLRPERFDDDAPLILGQMRQALLHRGPDDDGAWLSPLDRHGHQARCILGFRRLSIVDLQGGHQPMGNEDGTVQVVFNGEIYNHLELRRELEELGHVFASHSDTEVLVHGWEAWGTDVLARCNGMFDLAIWDDRRGSLLLARDRFGKKPLFVGIIDDGETLVFGSELSAVLAHPAVPKAVDPRGLAGLLLLDYVPSPRSMVQAVHALTPGSFYLWQRRPGEQRGATVTVATWHPPRPPRPELQKLTQSEMLHELDRRIQRAVERRLMADVPLGVFLSGGIDSSLVAWYAAQRRPAAELDTFAIGFDDPTFDESAHARAVAQHLGTRHHEKVLTAQECLDLIPDLLTRLDQPLADASIVPTTFLAQFARQHVTVALGGDGGDEWFLGYPTFGAHRLASAFDTLHLGVAQPLLQALVQQLPTSHANWSLDQQAKRFVRGLRESVAQRHFAWIGGLPWREALAVLHADFRARLGEVDPSPAPRRPEVLAALDESWAAWKGVAPDELSALAGLYARWYLADGVLQKVDRATMLHSLEARAPLLDPEVVELAQAMPAHCKLRRNTTKWALRQLAADKLPATIVKRPKKGFGVPLGAWLRGPLRGWLTDLLGDLTCAEAGFFDPAVV
ncbi:MAG: asparagine synthase (glutamine-hydrolyzing), partial [Deltaproteobacteria bacterium]|nr:asparagine synthase (glutamine-hydrolyzing) [Deltaproteobacteria bacterium]